MAGSTLNRASEMTAAPSTPVAVAKLHIPCRHLVTVLDDAVVQYTDGLLALFSFNLLTCHFNLMCLRFL